MNLHQLNLSFDARQDRLLLRISTTDQQEFRFWLTRRLVCRIWPRLVSTLQAAPVLPAATAPAAAASAKTAPRPELLEFRHAAAVQQADFATPYSSEDKKPVLSSEPLLVSQFGLRNTGLDRYEMTLASEGGPSVSLQLAAGLLHGLTKLLQDAVKSAEWNLSLALPAAPAASAAIN